MKTLKFWKMSGAGNDFVLVRAADLPRGLAPGALARRLCDRRRGVGADGLLAVGKAPRGVDAVRLVYHNADGSRAFCGNGSRCAAWFSRASGLVGSDRLTLLVDGGALAARVTGRERVRLQMPKASAIRLGLEVPAAGRRWQAHHIDTGVPHLVLFVRDLAGAPVARLGRTLRRHRRFAPRGANVNFVTPARGGLALRTYERGVEAETLACGTGAAAAAVVAALLGQVRPPVTCRTRGGDLLKVFFTLKPDPRHPIPAVSDLWLEGPARIVFAGAIDV